jgi:hypothetical protein
MTPLSVFIKLILTDLLKLADQTLNIKQIYFVDREKFKAKHYLWEFLTKSCPNMYIVTLQDRQAYKKDTIAV